MGFSKAGKRQTAIFFYIETDGNVCVIKMAGRPAQEIYAAYSDSILIAPPPVEPLQIVIYWTHEWCGCTRHYVVCFFIFIHMQ